VREISEGLNHNSLEYLIRPNLSIDEYESKISNNRAIVVGFFVLDEDPANDLSSFIDRSGYPVLDTEVSPHPTEEGYFVCWVEFRRDSNFPENFCKILKEVENLCKCKQWFFTCPGSKNKVGVSQENIKKYCILNPNNILDDVPDNLTEQDNFWKNAQVDYFYTTPEMVIFEKSGSKYYFKNLDYNKNLPIKPDNTNAIRLQKILGPEYGVYGSENGFLIEHDNQFRYIEESD
jgi:hypothetical protein